MNEEKIEQFYTIDENLIGLDGRCMKSTTHKIREYLKLPNDDESKNFSTWFAMAILQNLAEIMEGINNDTRTKE